MQHKAVNVALGRRRRWLLLLRRRRQQLREHVGRLVHIFLSTQLITCPPS